MKTLFVALAAIIILIGCQSPTDVKSKPEPTTPPVVVTPPVVDTPAVVASKVVVNSLWQKVTPSLRSISRDVTGADLVAYVENYNATTFDDYLRIYDSDAVPALEDAPAVSVFVCNPATYEVNVSHENVPRASLVENAVLWRADAYGQLIFIDHVPPAPILPTPYEYYAIYIVNADGSIEFEDHCGFHADGFFDGEWITTPSDQYVNGVQGGGWSSLESYFYQTQALWNSYLPSHPGSYKVLRQLYTTPVAP